MSHIQANILMLIATFIWGTAFVSQATGMGAIGPFTFSFARFFLASLTVLPLVIIYERKNFSNFLNNKNYIYLSLLAGLALFGGMGIQQYALLKSQVANTAFLSTLYVPFVSLISRFIFRSHLHWVIWIAVLLCLYGSYLLSSNQSFDIQKSDSLLFVAAFCFAIHIIIIDIFIKQFYSPFTFGFIQYFTVFIFSMILAFSLEKPTLVNIQVEWFEIIYTGIFSAGIGYTLQIIAQSKASPAPAAIILSMESVFGALAAWLLINQILDTNKILGCLAIFIGVIIVQLVQINTNKIKYE
jgi:drug/metabolite transporter (DMT)-like permease|tara:strand:+ start:196 stop:1089 length:894 start_codon:yes stop_codon:yes gene_type:complete